MDTNKISEFVERYENMHEDELAIIHQNQSSLVEEAKVALATVISERKIDLTKLAQEEYQEKEQRIKKRELVTEKKQKRDAFVYKAMLVIGVPICLFQLAFNPDKFVQTLFSTVAFAVSIGIISGIIYLLKKALKK